VLFRLDSGRFHQLAAQIEVGPHRISKFGRRAANDGKTQAGELFFTVSVLRMRTISSCRRLNCFFSCHRKRL
jgi:hypothetical protein